MEFLVILLKILFFQFVCFGTIFFVLARTLNKQLIGLALQKLELSRPESIPGEEEKLEVVVCSPMGEEVRQKINRIIFKKVHRPVNILVREDKAIRGGMIIHLKDCFLDYSLLTKLRQSGLIGKIFGA